MSEIYLYDRNISKNADYNVWFAFPECRSFSLSSLGYLWIYKEIDELENVFVEMISTDTEKTVKRVDEVDAIGFSLSFDMDFINVFKIMEKYNIPLKSKDRDENHPIIFAGGPVLTANPLPYKDFFDFIFVGDGEGANRDIIELCRKNKGC